MEQNKFQNNRRAATNIGLAKAGHTEVIEHLYFYQYLYLNQADGFQSPAFAKPFSLAPIVGRHITTKNGHCKT